MIFQFYKLSINKQWLCPVYNTIFNIRKRIVLPCTSEIILVQSIIYWPQVAQSALTGHYAGTVAHCMFEIISKLNYFFFNC